MTSGKMGGAQVPRSGSVVLAADMCTQAPQKKTQFASSTEEPSLSHTLESPSGGGHSKGLRVDLGPVGVSCKPYIIKTTLRYSTLMVPRGCSLDLRGSCLSSLAAWSRHGLGASSGAGTDAVAGMLGGPCL